MTISHEPLEFGKSPNAKSTVQFEPFTIGEVDWSIENDQLTLTVNGTEYAVAEDGFKYVVQYGLQQALTDSYAAETTLDKASKKFTERLKKIVDGTMPLDGKSTGDPVRAEMRNMAVIVLCKLHEKSETALRKELGKSWAKAVKAVLDKYADQFRARAESVVELRKFTFELPKDEDEQPEDAQPEGEKPTEEVVQPVVASSKAKRGRKAA